MSQQNKVGSHATSIYQSNGFTCVKYHATEVVKFNNEKIILNSGGWETATTKNRMNQASNQFGLNYHVFQRDFQWYVDFSGSNQEMIEVPFHNPVELMR